MAAIKLYLCFALSFYLIAVTTGTGDRGNVVDIRDNNWRLTLKGKWVLIFSSDSTASCELCSDLRPIWEKYSKWSVNLGIKVGEVDALNNPTLAGRFLIRTLPQSFFVENGTFRHFEMPSTKPDLFLYLERRSWETVEPIPGWQSPSSTLIGSIHKLLQVAKYVQDSLGGIKTKYGVPTPLAYLFFGVKVFIFGFLLGFLMILLIKLLASRKLVKRN